MEDEIKVVLRFQRLDLYGTSDNVNLHVNPALTLGQLKTKIYKKLNIEVIR